MDLPGASYFFTLAQVGITFSGFSAMLMALRQMRGAGMSPFHLWVARTYVQSGMVTAVNAMLAPLLSGLGLEATLVWQITSAFVAVQSLILISSVPRQWGQVTNRPLELRVKVHMGLGIALNLALLANALGWPYPPMGGILMVAISWNLFAFFVQFAESIRFFFEEEESEP